MKKLKEILTITAMVLVVTVTTAFAEQLNIKRFTVNPSPFRKGQTLRFSVEVENPTDRVISGAGDIFFSLRDGTPEREGKGSFLGRTPLPRLNPRSTVTVNIAQSYTVPRNAGDVITFTLHLPSIVTGVEFGPSFSSKYNASCTYSPEIRLAPILLKPVPRR